MLSAAGRGRVSEWFRAPPHRHPWKPVPYSPLAAAGRVSDGCRYGAVIGAVEGLRKPLENVPPKGCRNVVGALGRAAAGRVPAVLPRTG